MWFRELPQSIISTTCIQKMDEVRKADPNMKIDLLRNIFHEKIQGKLANSPFPGFLCILSILLSFLGFSKKKI